MEKEKGMRVLLIWEEIPENTKFFAIQDPTAEEFNILISVNGKYINLGDWEKVADDLLRANAATSNSANGFENAEGWVARWHESKVTTENLPHYSFQHVFHSGIYL